GRYGLARALAGVRPPVLEGRPALDSTGAAAADVVAAGPLYDPQRATADGATRLQSALPLVCWLEYGRLDLGRDDLHQESPTPARRRHRAGVLCAGGGPGARAALVVGGTLHRRRDTAGGVGRAEELSSAGERPGRPAAGRSGESHRELSWRAPQQCD